MSAIEQGKTISMDDVIRHQAELEEEAAEAIPFSFAACTYGNSSMTESKQPLYSCLSCRPHPLRDSDRAGICAGCSVSCHGDCELVELFSKRDFVCDCGTAKIPGKKCSLTLRQDDPPSSSNKYDVNFDGVFCVCRTRYDPETETDEMIQCLVCEDWYHTTKCLAKGVKSPHPDKTPLDPEAFDTFVCEACVLGPASRTIARYAGTPAFMVLSADGSLTSDLGHTTGLTVQGNSNFNEFNLMPTEITTSFTRGESINPLKRPLENATELDENSQSTESESLLFKSQKLDHSEEDKTVACSAPPLVNEPFISASLPRKDVYLGEDWRDRLCRCQECLKSYEGMPYLLSEEEVYEPPEDQDAGKSLLDLGVEAFLQMPREQAVHGMEAYTGLRDKLKKYLEPFAREGKVVRESDIEEFFEAEKRNKAELSGVR